MRPRVPDAQVSIWCSRTTRVPPVAGWESGPPLYKTRTVRSRGTAHGSCWREHMSGERLNGVRAGRPHEAGGRGF